MNRIILYFLSIALWVISFNSFSDVVWRGGNGAPSAIKSCTHPKSQFGVNDLDYICSKNFVGFTHFSNQGYPIAGNCEIVFNMNGVCGAANQMLHTKIDSVYLSSGSCPEGQVVSPDTGGCVKEPEPPKQCPEDRDVGNPIRIKNGVKTQSATDYVGAGIDPIIIARSYNSKDGKWHFSGYDRLLFGFHKRITWKMPSGSGILFTRADNNAPWVSLGNDYQLEKVGTEWSLETQDKDYLFNSHGILSSISYPSGVVHNFAFSPLHKPLSIEHSNGLSATFLYDDNEQLEFIDISDVGRIAYQYVNGNLENVNRLYDSYQETYHYEDTRFPNALTGITDSGNNRYATWRYDASGRAISSEHAVGVDKVSLQFNADNSVTVTNALGKSATYFYQNIAGVDKVVQVEGHASLGCAAANKAYTYWPSGLLKSKTDWQGVITQYEYNARGLKIKETAAMGAVDEIVTETTWHPTLAVPLTVTTPLSITEYQYNAAGQRISTVVTSR